MHEILILLEDEKSVAYFRLERWGRPARGALAKLKTLGWAEKYEKDNEIFYRITEKGEEAIDSILNALKPNKNWDKKWRLVMFEVPETDRSLRDKLRRSLAALGMGLLQASVWVTMDNIKDKIDDIAKSLNLENKIRHFEVSTNPALDRQITQKAWSNEETNLNLERFIKDAEWSMKQMGKGNGDQYKAKKLIYEYASIIKCDPKIPSEFIDNNELRRNAREIYLRLRHFAH